MTNVRFHGEPHYCPDCGRLLIEVTPDGQFELADNAGFTAQGVGDPYAGTGIAFILDAQCYECHPERADQAPSPPQQMQRFHWMWKQPATNN